MELLGSRTGHCSRRIRIFSILLANLLIVPIGVSNADPIAVNKLSKLADHSELGLKWQQKVHIRVITHT